MNGQRFLHPAGNASAEKPPLVWLIGGSDSGGGAGIQADLRTVTALGGHGCTVITAITAQNSRQLDAVFAVTPPQLLAQLDTLAADLTPAAIKIGQLPDTTIALALANWLAKLRSRTAETTPVIWDPVIYASSGAMLSELSFDSIRQLLQVVDILTPNLAELSWLSQTDRIATAVNDEQALSQLHTLRQHFSGDILLKGGHGDDPLHCTDLWCSGQQSSFISAPRQASNHSRGTGCTLASALATALALGYAKPDAVTIARAYLQQALRLSYPTGAGAGSLGVAGWPRQQTDFPLWQDCTAPLPEQLKFARLTQPIGLYPVVDDLQWLIRLLPLGVQTIQLRLKNKTAAELERQIQHAVELCRDYQIQLFINDHWQLAIKYQAFGVHLGQEDLADADLTAIAEQGLRLGVSTHGYAELARVLPLQPSYIALGHIFPTNTKQMPSAPQGLQRLQQYVRLCATLPSVPTVAIGGIDERNIQAVVQTGVRGVAVVSAILAAPQPEKALQQLQQYCHALQLTPGVERDAY
ncbi:thiamine-phosphate diphosphorylase [Rheinheimera sp. SA_1]|uniref:thiamine phosphate synthase n=1 Tax=Rheinheimera sp. SA_1 TaxID=1827365 RepID=UPI0008006B07|nr:thiamine phosphate synthase [Rheinheimera sp. SA_1]OBP15072.1 thiamine-phosphate diphosphorylase [Rheinheimera sp. SA_1]